MTFELTDELVDSIISALDNQEKKFVIDAENNSLVQINDEIACDEEAFYEIPSWTSKDGFSLMERFVNELHSPMARTDLLNVLRSGRGVFRGFKDVLKSYPEVEKRWHFFKNKELVLYINSWYNSLRETWGLEKLDCEIEETEELLHDDFMFTPFDFESDRDEILQCLDSATFDSVENWPKEVEAALSDLVKDKTQRHLSNDSCGFICRSISKEFIGSAVFSPCLSNAPNTVLLTSFFVQQKFRGLGIGSELLEQSLAELKNRHFKWVLIADIFITDTLTPLLIRTGFKKIGSGYILSLFAE